MFLTRIIITKDDILRYLDKIPECKNAYSLMEFILTSNIFAISNSLSSLGILVPLSYLAIVLLFLSPFNFNLSGLKRTKRKITYEEYIEWKITFPLKERE